MDKSQLVTIAVTAIITAFVKEIAGWLLSIAKNFAINETVKAKIKTAFTLNKITAITNLLIMVFCSWKVFGYVYSSDPVDRFAVFNIAFYTCAGIANLLRLELQLALHIEHLKQLRVAEQELEFAKQHAERLKPLLERADQAIAKSRSEIEPRTANKEAKPLLLEKPPPEV